MRNNDTSAHSKKIISESAKNEQGASNLQILTTYLYNCFYSLKKAYWAKFRLLFICVVSGLIAEAILAKIEKKLANKIEINH